MEKLDRAVQRIVMLWNWSETDGKRVVDAWAGAASRARHLDAEACFVLERPTKAATSRGVV